MADFLSNSFHCDDDTTPTSYQRGDLLPEAGGGGNIGERFSWDPAPPEYDFSGPQYFRGSETPLMAQRQPMRSPSRRPVSAHAEMAPVLEPNLGAANFQPYFVQPHSLVPHQQPKATSEMTVSARPAGQESCMPATSPAYSHPHPHSNPHPGQFPSESQCLLEYIREMHVMMMNQQTQLLYQMQLSQQQQRNRPIIIQNSAEVAATAEQSRRAAPVVKEEVWVPPWLQCFLRSRVNQAIILSGVIFGTYLLRERFRHEYRVDQMNARIESNLILRFVKSFEDAFGLRRVA